MTAAQHPRSRRTLRPALVAGLAAAAAGALLTTGCSPSDVLTRTKILRSEATVTDRVTDVEITDNGSGNVEVVARPAGSTDTTTRVTRAIHYVGDTAPKPTQKVSGGVLTVDKGCSEGIRGCSADWVIEVPAGTRVRLGASSGDVTARGVADAELSTSSGDVRAENVTGTLRLAASSGDVVGTGLKARDTTAETSSGNLVLAWAAAPGSLRARSGSGDTTVRVPGGPYRVTGKTGSGDRTVSVPTSGTAVATLDVTSGSGDATVEH
ncbi:DUF4097 family beta strand repeat-containing protein [Streptomyces sp. BI20]|uniref:DUF4097 family beta strand repeat-containing protein n=1 Tax=Streptomyces sp. BI20 TaxID=3403460 RepID=UPI003C7707AD